MLLVWTVKVLVPAGVEVTESGCEVEVTGSGHVVGVTGSVHEVEVTGSGQKDVVSESGLEIEVPMTVVHEVEMKMVVPRPITRFAATASSCV
jgi:hypothetical protein